MAEVKEFYDGEIAEEHRERKNGPILTRKKTVPFFKLHVPSKADVKAEPFIFDGPATEQHKKHYSKEWEAYQAKKNPPAPLAAPEELPAPEPDVTDPLQLQIEKSGDLDLPRLSIEKNKDLDDYE